MSFQRPERRAPVIRVERLLRTYRVGDVAVHALRGISLRIERGEHVAIMGPSGSGKSTLMNVLGCLDAPTSGRYLLDGIDVASHSEDELSDLRNRKIGFVFQGFNLVPRMSALANVELPLAYAGLERASRRRRALLALESVGMSDRAKHTSAELSGGQQQRVAIARAIVTNPAIVLADEPTGNLDSRSSAEVLALFEELHEQGRTLLIITHESEVAHRAQRLIVLGDGRVVSDQMLPAGQPPLRPRQAGGGSTSGGSGASSGTSSVGGRGGGGVGSSEQAEQSLGRA